MQRTERVKENLLPWRPTSLLLLGDYSGAYGAATFVYELDFAFHFPCFWFFIVILSAVSFAPFLVSLPSAVDLSGGSKMPDRGDSLQTVGLDQMLPRVESSIHAHL